MRKPVIALDGYSSTGKSSISKIIAQRLGIIHLDTGALYRGVTWYAINHCHNDKSIDLNCLFSNFDHIHLEFQKNKNELDLLLNGVNINKEIRLPKVSENVSFIAKQPEVRSFLLEAQKKMAENGGIIMDGRDIGTVILPNADYKFFLTASTKERARRRYEELKAEGIPTTIEEVEQNLLTRDKIDSEREVAPLKMASDAILIDNTNLNKEETIDLIISYIQ